MAYEPIPCGEATYYHPDEGWAAWDAAVRLYDEMIMQVAE